MALNYEIFVKGIGLAPNSSTLNSSRGDLEVLTSDSKIYYHNGTTNSALVTETSTATLTNKTISGSSNTLSNIANASLTNSSVTVNGNTVSLGGSTTITANTTNALTIGTGLSGTSFNGSSPVTITIDSTVATLSGTQVLTNKTIDASLNTISNITNTEISASAAIAFSKLATLTSANILVGNGSNVATSVSVSGDISLSNTGVTAYSGIVPLNKGGTGTSAASANAAFNVLSPLTTKGDVLSYSTVNARLPVGTDGQVITADSTQTLGIKWATPTSSSFTAPTVQKFISGTGATYTTPTSPAPLYIRVRMVGGGGGGSGSGSAAGSAPGAGIASSFGTSLLSAGGGSAGGLGSPGGSGGTSSLGSGPVGLALTGAPGGASGSTAPGFATPSGLGGSSIFGGGGLGAFATNAGGAAATNSGGGGGGGGGAGTNVTTGSGGGSGGGIDAIIYTPTATYTYTVGTGGAAGGAGTSGAAGGAGADGLIIVEEYYQ